MDKAKILRLCNEIEDIATEIMKRTMKDSCFMAQTIIDKVLVIAAEITTPPKSNGDSICNMNDEELADWLTDGHDNCDLCQHGTCRPEFECEKGVLAWLRQEVKEDADNS